jgi:hypothetical protein
VPVSIFLPRFPVYVCVEGNRGGGPVETFFF